MGDEPTEAAEPVADATEAAPSEDQTQGIYAWSEADSAGTEDVVPHRRSWKLPVALAGLATAAAVAAGTVMLWPESKPAPRAQTPPVAVPTVPAPEPPQPNPRPLKRDSRGIPVLPKNP